MTTETHRHTARCWWNPDQAAWVCRPAADRPLVDVRDMLVVHTALLREFRLAPAAVRRVGAGDARQAGVVAAHLRFVGDLLHHHHEGEDALLWPTVLERAPEAAAAVVADVEAQHAGIDAALRAAVRLREEWAADPSAGRREHLAAQLETLSALLGEHLELEERALLPLAAGTLTDAEWHAVGEQAVAGMAKPDLVLSFGMFAYEGDPAVLHAMLAPAPAPVRVLLPRLAPRVYARRARRVHGTRRP